MSLRSQVAGLLILWATALPREVARVSPWMGKATPCCLPATLPETPPLSPMLCSKFLREVQLRCSNSSPLSSNKFLRSLRVVRRSGVLVKELGRLEGRILLGTRAFRRGRDSSRLLKEWKGLPSQLLQGDRMSRRDRDSSRLVREEVGPEDQI